MMEMSVYESCHKDVCFLPLQGFSKQCIVSLVKNISFLDNLYQQALCANAFLNNKKQQQQQRKKHIIFMCDTLKVFLLSKRM